MFVALADLAKKTDRPSFLGVSQDLKNGSLFRPTKQIGREVRIGASSLDPPGEEADGGHPEWLVERPYGTSEGLLKGTPND